MTNKDAVSVADELLAEAEREAAFRREYPGYAHMVKTDLEDVGHWDMIRGAFEDGWDAAMQEEIAHLKAATNADEEEARLFLLGAGYHYDRGAGTWVRAAPNADDKPVAEPLTWSNDEVERRAKRCGWNNRSYMTPADYTVWCDRMRQFAAAAHASPPDDAVLLREARNLLESVRLLVGGSGRFDELAFDMHVLIKRLDARLASSTKKEPT